MVNVQKTGYKTKFPIFVKGQDGKQIDFKN